MHICRYVCIFNRIIYYISRYLNVNDNWAYANTYICTPNHMHGIVFIYLVVGVLVELACFSVAAGWNVVAYVCKYFAAFTGNRFISLP